MKEQQMKVSEAFSGYLDAEDIPAGRDIPVTIEGVRESGDKDKGQDGKPIDKPIVKLKGVKKEWVLNKTNGKMIRREHGNIMNEWVGKKVVVYQTKCSAFGKQVPCIRVRGEEL